MTEPSEILEQALQQAEGSLTKPIVTDDAVRQRIEFVAQCLRNRAGIRLLLSCLLAKTHKPKLDIRQPYTEIGGNRCYSGRTYDETFVTGFINRHRLPCNSTTAFLTPALRNISRPLMTDSMLTGNPPEMYRNALQLLDDVQSRRVSPSDALAECVRQLVLLRDEKAERMNVLLSKGGRSLDSVPLSSEAIVTLISQHLACRNASRLPVLVVAAAYRAVAGRIGEHPKPLLSHNAADEQTGAIGDVEIYLTGEDHTLTSYEMKLKAVTRDDIDRAVTKIVGHDPPIHNYLFVTTESADQTVHDYAALFYDRLGVEIAILDCLGFLRHLLHFFHRYRMAFLDAYQELLLAEPESAVRQALKEAFLSLRLAAETGDET